MIANVNLRVAHAKIRRGDGYLYVAEVSDGTMIKIGFSLDPEARIWSLRNRKVRLLGYFRCTLRQERLFHGRLKAFRVSDKHFFAECYPRAVIGTEVFADALRALPPHAGKDDAMLLAMAPKPARPKRRRPADDRATRSAA